MHDIDNSMYEFYNDLQESSLHAYDNFTFICTDRSNCGSLRNMLYAYTRKTLTRFIDEDSYNVELYCIGRKIARYISMKYRELIRKTFIDLAQETAALYLSYVFVSKLLESEFDTCTLIFNRYITTPVQCVSRYTFNSFNNFYLSLTYLLLQRNQVAYMLLSKWAQSPSLLRNFYYFAVSLLVLDCIEELEYCEAAARATSMEQTVNNLDELIA
jgi:F0F1-type ATP synthase gamma subunit